MTELTTDELIAALTPVQRHHRPGDVTIDSVLAAYLRAADIQPDGKAWAVAKAEFQHTHDFARSTRAAASSSNHAGRAPDPREASTHSAPVLTRAIELRGARNHRGPLDWFPQKFEPGAIQGAGAKKLLGTPKVSMEELLVRETAQNSWDARLGDRPVEFILNLRQLDPDTIRTLSESVFTGASRGTQIQDVLANDTVVAVEISDRGTFGLGGPVRNDHAIPTNSVTHFIDLIFNIGTSKGDPTSGGTYGFGKSIAYMVSEAGAIVVWSRCATDRGPEDRLIASAIGDVFDMDGFRYTGRHWWGRTVDDRPEPVVGPLAIELGQKLFAKPFEGDELGTSILILAPQLGEPGPEDDARVLTDAVLRNLWPKLLPDASGALPMQIRVQVDGVDHPMPDPSTHPVLAGPVSCLLAIRAVQSGERRPHSLFAVDVREIKRRSEVLGHIALTKYPIASGGASGLPNSHAVTLMRNGAELVVRQIERAALAEPGFQWAGVFKPIADLDATFARSEPPAHDDWSPASLQDKTQRSQVNVAMRRIQEAADRFIEPYSSTRSTESSTSAASVGDMLAGLMAGSSGSAPSRARSGHGAGSARSPQGSVKLEAPDWRDASTPGWTRTVVPVRLVAGSPAGSVVRVEVGVGTDGGTEFDVDPSFLRGVGWEQTGSTEPALMIPGQVLNYCFESSDEVAIDVVARIVRKSADE